MNLFKKIMSKLLGKEEEQQVVETKKPEVMPEKAMPEKAMPEPVVEYVQVSEKTKKIVEAFGGISNISGFNVGATKLRYDVNDSSLVDEDKLKILGASEVVLVSARYVEAKFGEEADQINSDIKLAIPTLKKEAMAQPKTETMKMKKEEKPSEMKEKRPEVSEVEIVSPAEGEIVDLETLDDGVFSARMLGDGFVVDIKGKKSVDVFSPVDGKLTVVFPSKHAYGILSPDGLELLIHIGIDTVKLGGIGFTSFVSVNETVIKGQKLVTLDVSRIQKEGYNPNVITVITPDSKFQKLSKKTDDTFVVSK